MLARLKALWSQLGQSWQNFKALCEKDLKSLWNEYRTVFILLGALILTVKFRDWLIDLIVSNGKRLFQNTQKKNDALQQKENQVNQQADDLVKKANDLPNQEQPVNDDWYKK